MPKAATFKPLTNRATTRGGKFTLPDDGFVMLVPKGEAPNVMDDGSAKGKRIIQVVDDEALGLIMNKLLNRGGDEMLIDDEHFSHDSDKATDANGWQPLEKDSLQNRADGLYGDPRWSTKGLENVEGGVKRYVSPEFSTSTLQPLGGNRYRVTELTGLALTNRPGFRRLQKPLTNRDADGGIETANTNTMHKALLAGLLGITDTALDALDEPTLKNRLSVIKEDAAKAVTLKTELDTLHNRDVEAFMKTHDAVIPKDDAVRGIVKSAFLANRAAAEVMVAGFTATGGEQLTDAEKERSNKKPMFNRDKATPPENDPAGKEQKAADWVGARARELTLNNRSMRHQDAFRQAESEYAAKNG